MEEAPGSRGILGYLSEKGKNRGSTGLPHAGHADMHSVNDSPRGFNAGHYSSPEVDALLDRARRTQEDESRKALYRQAHAQIMDDLPVLPMLTLARGMVCHHPRVRGFRNARQNWHSFKNLWIDAKVDSRRDRK